MEAAEGSPKRASLQAPHGPSLALAKFQPRFSARRDSTLSLNGKVKLDNERIVCRHIAKLWEDDFLRTAGKPSYHTLDSPDALQAAAGSLALTAASKYANFGHERVDQARYWVSNDWGQVLTDNFKAMPHPGDGDAAVCRTLYLLTPTHAMALGLKIKNSAGARRFVVQFYDPNNTVAHQRMAITAESTETGVPAEIRKLQAHDFLSEFSRKAYRLVDADDRSIPALFAGEKAEPGMPRLAGDLPDFDEHVMSFLLTHDLPELLRACADQFRQRGDMTRLLSLLGSGNGNAPRLYFAFQWGQTETMEILGDILKTLQPRLSSEQLAYLLSARSRDGIPGLYAALQKNHIEVIGVFGELLKAFQPRLSSEQLARLLSAKMHTGTPGLFAAMHDRSSEAVLAYGELLKTFSAYLSPEHLSDLLSAKYWTGSIGQWDGAPGLYFSLRFGHTEMVQAFGKILEPVAGSLSPEQLSELLSAKDRKGIRGISFARQSRHIETVAAFEALKAKFALHA